MPRTRLALVAPVALCVGLVATSACRRTRAPEAAPVDAATTTGEPAAAPPAAPASAAAPLAPALTETSARPPAAAPAGLLALPHVTLVAMSDAAAVLKPCGCTEELQRGGVERNARWLRDAARDDPALALVHAGTLLVEEEPPAPRLAAQRAMRQRTYVDVLAKLPVAAVALSSVDLERGGEAVAALLADSGLPLVADGWDHGVAGVATHRLVTLPDGLTRYLFALDPAAGELDAQRALAERHVAAARAAGADVVVALSNLGLRNSRRLARGGGLDAVVIGAVPDRFEPVDEADREGDVWLLETPRHGAAMAVLTLAMHGEGGAVDASAWLPATKTLLAGQIAALEADLRRLGQGRQTVATERSLPFWRRSLAALRERLARVEQQARQPLPRGRLGAYRSVALSWDAPVDSAVAAVVATYDAAVAKANQQALAEPLPAVPGAASYVGAAVCLNCHAGAAAFARDDLHGHAFATLEKAGKAADLDCVGCHSTGWLAPGGAAFGNLERFKNVQCEACHGPGSAHLAAADKAGGAGLEARPGERVCLGCHTPEHAPRFDFRAYVPRLRVPGHAAPP